MTGAMTKTPDLEGLSEFHFGPNLRFLINREGLTMVDAAKKVGVGNKTLYSILDGVTRPSLPTVVKVAKTFDVSLDWLCRRHP